MAFLWVLVLVFVSSVLHAQQPPVHIDVASVRPHVSSGDNSSDRSARGGRFTASATSVQTLIRSAFSIDARNIMNAPPWTESELWDVQATIADHTEITTPERYGQLMLSLLQEEFGFQYHKKQRESPVYWLVLDKAGRPGPELKEGTPGAPPNISMNGNNRIDMRVTNVTLDEFGKAIQRRAGRNVEDHAGLTDRYSFHLRWSADPSPETDDPSLPAVLKEQLGLRLLPKVGTVEAVFVDHIERPAAK